MDESERSRSLETTAADGRALAPAATSAGSFIDMIEDGQFAADAHQQIVELAATMSDLAMATGSKQRGKVTITVDLLNEGGVFTAVGKIAVKAPELKRRPTLLWTDDRNRFTRQQPRQGGFFGVREVVTLDKGDVRTIG